MADFRENAYARRQVERALTLGRVTWWPPVSLRLAPPRGDFRIKHYGRPEDMTYQEWSERLMAGEVINGLHECKHWNGVHRVDACPLAVAARRREIACGMGLLEPGGGWDTDWLNEADPLVRQVLAADGEGL